MARLQILELPEGAGDDRPPFALVVDQCPPQRYILGQGDAPVRDYWQDIARQIGARGVIVTPETVDIPANDTTAHPHEVKEVDEASYVELATLTRGCRDTDECCPGGPYACRLDAARNADEGQAEPPAEEAVTTALPDHPDPRQAAYDAAYEYIRALGHYLPPDPARRNAMIWRAVHAALGATPVGRCVSSHCVEGDHILGLGATP